MPTEKISGAVALLGRPNAGKSTLMNRLLGEKVAIVSKRPQTTRHRLVGILNTEEGQVVFYDTPGIHKPQYRMNRRMVQEATDSLEISDVLCLLVDATKSFGSGDQFLLDLLEKTDRPRILLLNKIDKIKKHHLLPFMERYQKTGLFSEIIPISALEGDGTEVALECFLRYLPQGPPLYDPELLTIHPERYLVAERVREKLLEKVHEEIPFSTAVVVDRWEEEEGLIKIYASILVERPGQKSIIIGKGGRMIKAIGTEARVDLENYLESKVYLDLHVKEEPKWRENLRILEELDRELKADFS